VNPKVTAVANLKEIDEQELHELIEKRFKKILREEKDIEFKEYMKSFDNLNPDNFPSIRDLTTEIRAVILGFVIIIWELRRKCDEAQQKLEACQNKS
jgi:hypothetical protein